MAKQKQVVIKGDNVQAKGITYLMFADRFNGTFVGEAGSIGLTDKEQVELNKIVDKVVKALLLFMKPTYHCWDCGAKWK